MGGGAEAQGSFPNKWNILKNSAKQNRHEISSFSLELSVVRTATPVMTALGNAVIDLLSLHRSQQPVVHAGVRSSAVV